MLDANIVVAKCIEAVYDAADRYRPVRVGTWAGRVLPKSDGSQVVKLRVNIVYAGGVERYAPIDCVITNSGVLTLKEHRE